MVLAALAFEPEEFVVGVDIFGVSNWLRTLQSIPPYWESFRKALYAEIGDPAGVGDGLVAVESAQDMLEAVLERSGDCGL